MSGASNDSRRRRQFDPDADSVGVAISAQTTRSPNRGTARFAFTATPLPQTAGPETRISRVVSTRWWSDSLRGERGLIYAGSGVLNVSVVPAPCRAQRTA
jgi:hypothetical protein